MNPLIAVTGTVALGWAAYSVPRNIRRARVQRSTVAADAPLTIKPAEYGLVPASELNTVYAAPDPEADDVVAAALAGDWSTAAGYLAAAGSDWDLRWYRLGQLAHAAAEDDTWLRAWRAEYPYDPAAALVQADALVVLAGNIRGAKRAKYTTADQFEGFRRTLAEALPACREAARMAPHDPSPWVAQITIAVGLGWSHEEFTALWAEIAARAPHHFGAHIAALQYWCAKWSGSRELMFAFAERAAASAPYGSLLPVLRLYAMAEQQINGDDFDFYAQPSAAAAVDATLGAVAQVPVGHHRLPLVRHLLAYYLVRSQRYAEAVEQFRAVDGYCGAVPWQYFGAPAESYVSRRAEAFARWDQAGRPAAPARHA
ncbi:hypothetical protein ACFC0S_07960 [Streptomyces sp. NPDC056084]|uniref:hypothetical protein n=1 Tax=unclassified Streptomyces TaxID=2593676 RepID=UPI0035E14F65